MIHPLARRTARTDGNFAVPHPSATLPFTGERMTTVMEGQIEFEHYHRYCLARDLCDGLDVLDVASGEGYGSALLAGVARSVTGVEIDAGSVAHAQTAYTAPNLRFLQGDALAIPAGDASFDAVISFETLEHLADQARFLQEVRRVLRPGGLFLVSTPDRTVYSAPGSDPNPYHVLELTPGELQALLGAHFQHHTILSQRPLLGSVMAGGGEAWRSYERRNTDRIEATNGLARAHYLVAIASDAALPEIGPSVYADRRRVHDVMQDALSVPALHEGRAAAERSHMEAMAAAERSHVAAMAAGREAAAAASLAAAQLRIDATTAERDAAAAALAAAQARTEATRAERDAAAANLAATEAARAEALRQRDEAQRQLQAVTAQLGSVEQMLNAVWTSTSWRILGPFRRLGRRYPRAARRLRQAMKLVWWTLTLQLGYRFMLWRRHRLTLQQPVPAVSLTDAQSPPPATGLNAPPSPPEPGTPPSPAQAQSAAAPSRDLLDAFQTLHGSAAIHFPLVAEPEVSIIIPAYRGLDDLLTCLRSIAVSCPTEPSFEVIVVDDCPVAPVLWALPRSGGLIGIANEENLGFLLSCNRGAEKARGRVLCFLNSDTVVSPGWLGSLVQALDETPRAGLAGSMLLNRDGTIQDAGWRIMWNGWGHPLGRGADARDGAYTHRRLVDCVTGACFCVPRPVWDQLGGFDLAYAPAFYEEFDLAFRAKQQGLKTIYEPRSRVVHLGSASYGAERRDQLSTINHGTFSKRFAEILGKQPHDASDEYPLRHAGPKRPTILVVDYGVPVPDRHAGDVTMSGYLRMLVGAGWRVVFAPHDGVAEGPPCEALETIGIEMIRAPQTVAGWLAVNGRHVQQVWLCRPELAAALLPIVRNSTSARTAYYTHDLHYLRLMREARLRNDPAMEAAATKVREQEVGVLRAVDHVLTPSVDEGHLIRELAPTAQITTLPPYYYEAGQIRSRGASQFEGLSDILFVGGFPHTPNVDAALFIAREVMPLVWKERPEARLLLVGYAPPAEVQALATDRIIVTGQVAELAPWFDQSRVMLAALRYGAGVKGKVVEALRCGLPVVTTSVGAEGIGITPGDEAVVAEDAADLAAGVLELFADSERCARLSAAGAALVARRFSRAAARATLEGVFQAPRCAACGSVRLLPPPQEGNPRESFVCQDCYALARCEALAKVLLRRFGREGETSLPELLARRPGLRVHELGFVGGIADSLRGFPSYSESEYFPGVPLGTPGPAGVRCEDVTQLTYADESFDIILSQDVMEHVPGAVRGFAETARVLRPGGSHFFTIPQNPHLRHSVTRAKLGPNGVEHLLPPEYHGDPVRAEGALVFTDYGRDLSEIIAAAGLELIEHDQAVLGGAGGIQLRIFEAIKRATPLPALSHEDALLMADLQDRNEAFEKLIGGCYADTLAWGDTAIDGGANFGMHTRPMAAIIGTQGRLYAFEPLPHAAAAVRATLGHLPQLTLHQKALGQAPGRAVFHHVVNDAALSRLLKRDLSFAYPDLEIVEIEVEVVTLDTLAAEPVRFIKLDLEGYDFLALRGGRALLTAQQPIIAFEFGRKDAAIPAGYGADDFFGFFAEINYTILDLFGRPFGPAEFDLPWDAREMPHYVVATPTARQDEVAAKLRRRAWSILMEAGRQPPG